MLTVSLPVPVVVSDTTPSSAYALPVQQEVGGLRLNLQCFIQYDYVKNKTKMLSFIRGFTFSQVERFELFYR